MVTGFLYISCGKRNLNHSDFVIILRGLTEYLYKHYLDDTGFDFWQGKRYVYLLRNIDVRTMESTSLVFTGYLVFLPWELGRQREKLSSYTYSFCNIYTFQRDTQCCSTDCLLMHTCQFCMFRTVTVHLQELLFRCCMCSLWHVL